MLKPKDCICEDCGIKFLGNKNKHLCMSCAKKHREYQKQQYIQKRKLRLRNGKSPKHTFDELVKMAREAGLNVKD